MKNIKLSDDMTVSVFSEYPEDRDYRIAVFYIEWKDTKTNKVVVSTSLTTIAKALANPASLVDIAMKNNLSEGDLNVIDNYLTARGAKEMRELYKELENLPTEEEIEDWYSDIEE